MIRNSILITLAIALLAAATQLGFEKLTAQRDENPPAQTTQRTGGVHPWKESKPQSSLNRQKATRPEAETVKWVLSIAESHELTESLRLEMKMKLAELEQTDLLRATQTLADTLPGNTNYGVYEELGRALATIPSQKAVAQLAWMRESTNEARKAIGIAGLVKWVKTNPAALERELLQLEEKGVAVDPGLLNVAKAFREEIEAGRDPFVTAGNQLYILYYPQSDSP